MNRWKNWYYIHKNQSNTIGIIVCYHLLCQLALWQSCLGGYQVFLTISFLSAVLDDLLFIYLCVKALIISSNNLVNEFFLSANSNLHKVLFLDQFSSIYQYRTEYFFNIMKIYWVPIFRSFTKKFTNLVISGYLQIFC